MPADPDIADPLKWTMLQGRAYAEPTGPCRSLYRQPRPRMARAAEIVSGSSCLHAMAYVRGHPDDFEPWAQAGWRALVLSGIVAGLHPQQRPSRPSTRRHVSRSGPLQAMSAGRRGQSVVRAYIAAGRAMGAPTLRDRNSGELVGTSPNSLNARDGKRVSLRRLSVAAGHGAAET